MPNSISYAHNLEGYLTSGRTAYSRQVSSSAPTSTIDIEGLVREELSQEHEIIRDRRKKDIHNMSKWIENSPEAWDKIWIWPCTIFMTKNIQEYGMIWGFLI